MGRKPNKIYETDPGIFEKACFKCGCLKSVEDFYREKHHTGGRRNSCKACDNRDYYEWKPERQSRRLQKLYGITFEEKECMIAECEGKCQVCGLVKPLSVDHNHITGIIRGVICNSCNRGIGFLGDSVDGLRRALTYLEKAVL